MSDPKLVTRHAPTDADRAMAPTERAAWEGTDTPPLDRSITAIAMRTFERLMKLPKEIQMTVGVILIGGLAAGAGYLLPILEPLFFPGDIKIVLGMFYVVVGFNQFYLWANS